MRYSKNKCQEALDIYNIDVCENQTVRDSLSPSSRPHGCYTWYSGSGDDQTCDLFFNAQESGSLPSGQSPLLCQPYQFKKCPTSPLRCRLGPPCTNRNGLVKNNNICTCGSDTCKTGNGLYCNADIQTCATVPKCQNKNQLTANTEDCICSLNTPWKICDQQFGQYCNYDNQIRMTLTHGSSLLWTKQ